MTTYKDDYPDRILRFGAGRTDNEGGSQTAFGDATAAYPRADYHNESSVNKTARGGGAHQLSVGGSAKDNKLDIGPPAGTQYGFADVRETASGHVIELNDTPGGERVLIKHATGSGVEFRPDGSVLLTTSRNRVEVTQGDNTVIVEGDVNLNYKGNLTLNVQGDFEVNCNNYKVNAKGDKEEHINGNSSQSVFGSAGFKVSGNFSETIAGRTTRTTLGDQTIATKGRLNVPAQGDVDISSGGVLTSTAKTRLNASSPDVNIAGTSLSVFGDTGTIGGENMVMYTKTIYGVSGDFSQRFKAPVFEGDLTGTAARAVDADTAHSQSYADPDPGGGVGSSPGYTVDNTAIDTTATAKPTESLLTSYLNKSDRGVKKVNIDVGDFLLNSLRARKLSTEDVRSKLREQANRDNNDFCADQVAQGKLNSDYTKTSPSKFGRIRSTTSGGCQRGVNTVGNANGVSKVQTFRTTVNKKRFDIVPEPVIAKNIAGTITNKTKVNFATSVSKFVGANDTGAFLELSNKDRQQLARNYFIHSELMKTITSSGPHPTPFEDYRLEVVEGYYAKELYGVGTPSGIETETLAAGGLLDLRNKGQAVVYELIGSDGKIDVEATFDLAAWWADIGYFNKLTLDYDTYAPDGSLNVQLIVEIPKITEFTNIKFDQQVQTMFNNKVQSKDSLVEITL